MLGRASACWRARGASGGGAAAAFGLRGVSRAWFACCFLRARTLSCSLLFDAVAGAGDGVQCGVTPATQVSPFRISPVLHSIGQTRVVCLDNSATRSLVTTGLSVG